MLDLTGGNLVAYILRIVKDSVSSNPRFRNTLGDVTFQNNQMVQWGNVQVVIKNISASGTRLSSDYFMFTLHGRVTVAKVGDKQGAFIEWPLEIDKTRQTPTPGVYYLQVDYTDEKTQQVDLTLQSYKWTQGKLKNAQGSVVYFNPALNLDLTTLVATEVETGNPVQMEYFNSSINPFAYVLTPCQTLVFTLPNGSTLNQNGTDYWYQRYTDVVICESTVGGPELMNIAVPFVSATFSDQDGYQLRLNQDYIWQGPDWIKVAQWTPVGDQITAHLLQKIAPSFAAATNPENIVNIGLTQGSNTLVEDQVFFHTTAGDFPGLPVNSDGTITLPQLLTPGQWLRWEARIDTGVTTIRGKKYVMNGFQQTIIDPKYPTDPSKRTIYLDPTTQQPVDPLPGLWLAIGDWVVAGDQVAVIVNPEVTETYEVFGSKDNISFTLECKANDLQTASDLAEVIKRELLIFKRENMERDGVTILEAPREFSSAQRDISGVNPTFSSTQTFSGLADWKVFMPLVTRMAAFELNDTVYSGDFLGKVQLPQRIKALGATMFLSSYA